ncbi:hypothetical protein LINPERPRIM_LOCUS5425 [Linum perenne]
MLDKYYVGEIDVSTIPKKTSYKPPNQQFLVPIAILGLAFAIRFYTKKTE